MTRHQAHPSEQVVARIRTDSGWDQRYGKAERRSVCRDCGFYHDRIRYSQAHQASPDGTSLVELVAATLTLLLLFGAVFVAGPIILEVLR